MILALSFLKTLYDGYKALTAPPDQEVVNAKQRQKLAYYAIDQLNRQGGYFLNVEGVRGKSEGAYSSDIQVSILFRVQARPGQFVAQHISYSVDISSWKAMTRDLTVLGQQFAEASRRAYPEEEHPSEFLVTDYAEFIDHLKEKSQAELKL